MKPRHKRAAMIVGGLAALGLAAYLVLNAFESNLVFFFSPTQVAAGEAPKNRTFRIGGLVKTGSVSRDNLTVNFIVTDTAKEMGVSYTGILPDLFKEGKGVVAQGKFDAGGKFVVNPQFDEAASFSEGLAQVRQFFSGFSIHNLHYHTLHPYIAEGLQFFNRKGQGDAHQ